jgi:hypothetical protein
MTKHLLILLVFTVLENIQLQAQDADRLPAFKSEQFRSIEVKTGIGILPRIYDIPINIVYQQNVKRGFSTIFYSEVLSTFSKSSESNYHEFIWLEAAGVGKTIGNNSFNHGLYLLGGGRLYHSNLTLYNTDFNQSTLVTKTITPELGLLYNLKAGKKKLYFSTQFYFALTPLKNIIEARHTLMLGIGYRLNTKKN